MNYIIIIDIRVI